MTLFPTAADQRFARAISRLVYVNPFLPERIAAERDALGDAFSEASEVWTALPGDSQERPNVRLLQARAESLAEVLRERRGQINHVAADDQRLYNDLVLYVLYYRSWRQFDDLLANPAKTRRIDSFKSFSADFRHFYAHGLSDASRPETDAHLFALFYQLRRAFQAIFRHILGRSMPVAQLRAAVWQSIFTCDLEAYRRGLFDRLDDAPTLINGESGTGKELVARAIAHSRYIPFDAAAMSFTLAPAALFLPLNLSALSPTLIESELFGHRRGAFTGALENRVGWLEHCPSRGAVFLDEIGELEGQIQVKLLRVLQARTFSRLGENQSRVFQGKLIAATNRNLADEMHAGRFRTDLYYRLCADLITTPTLAQQLKGSPDALLELRLLVRFIAQRVAGTELAEDLTRQVVDFVQAKIPADYTWPGNFRELEQCVRNILIRREYQPARMPIAEGMAKSQPPTAGQELAKAIDSGTLSADELLDRYIAMTHAKQGTYEATARALKLDRRTVKARLRGK